MAYQFDKHLMIYLPPDYKVTDKKSDGMTLKCGTAPDIAGKSASQ